jgi:DNA helicase-2/ATP-dependent DNA helicase PcrA
MATLTEEQAKVVEHFTGPLLVLAGPGSGKTRVVTHRIARLIERGVPGYSILAITFTNKAAREMKHRVETMLPNSRVFVSTFHRFCSWLLRRHAEAVGLKDNFSIFDTSDQQSLVRRCLEELNIDKKLFSPGRLLGIISRQKNELITPEMYQQSHRDGNTSHIEAIAAKLYPKYQQSLREANAVDFDDLLMHAVTLFEDNEELRLQYQNRFQFLLVDEYQDTNFVQYSLVKALGSGHQNVCATGDPDQLIYSWRGSRLENIMQFARDFPTAAVYKLEQNFRSTKAILRPADQLIAHNKYRKAKRLFTENTEGQPVEVQLYQDQNHEADEIAQRIKRTVTQGDRKWNDYAILFRVNALSRPLELALYRHGIPYQVAGGVEFWQRAEIKDMTAYMRVLVNPSDNEALLRVINTPVRGIGKKSQDRLTGWANRYRGSVLEACRHVDELPGFASKTAKAVQAFVRMLDELSADAGNSVSGLVSKLMERTKIALAWENSKSEDDLQRKANIDELITAATEYEKTHTDDSSLQGFLEETVLVSDQDSLDEDLGKVSLMTLHSAKGLEFPVVYLVGMEEEILPHERALKSTDHNDLEEERRLLFVGMTRAQQELYLTETKIRMRTGRVVYTIPSGFRSEMVPEFKSVNISQGELPEWTYGNGQTAAKSFSSGSPLNMQAMKTAADLLRDELGQVDPDESHAEDVEFPFGKEATIKTPTKIQHHTEHDPDDMQHMPEHTETLHRVGKPLITPQQMGARGRNLLTTGAQLLAQQTNELEKITQFTPGTHVMHPRYGKGEVLSLSGTGPRAMVTVQFETRADPESFMLLKSPLSIATTQNEF